MQLITQFAIPSSNPATPDAHQLQTQPTGWKFTVQRPDGELYYRTKQSGSLKLTGPDYQWLLAHWQSQVCCAEIWVNVYQSRCASAAEGDELTPFWPGYFTLNAVRWNFTDCTAEVRDIKSRDGYDALYRVWDKPVDLLATTQAGGGLGRIGVVAMYADYRTWQPDPNGIMQHVLPDGNAAGSGYLNREHEYANGLPLLSFLTKLAIDTTTGTSAATIGIRIVSDFYSASVNPVTKRTNNQKVFMAGSDAKRPASKKPAVKLVVTLKEMLDELKALHNVYHCIDPQSGLLRIEHYSWFAEQSYSATKRVAINLLKYPDALAKANNESVDIENLYGYEELRIENNSASRYPGMKVGTIKYEGACLERDEKGQLTTNTITASRVFTDLENAYLNPEQVADDTIFLAELVPPGTNTNVQSRMYQLADVYASDFFGTGQVETNQPGLPPNSAQSAAALFVDYHRYGRSYASGLVNAIRQKDGSYSEGALMYMLSRRLTRRQEGVIIPVCCDDLPIDLRGFIKTNRFDRGQLDKAVFDPDADTLTVDVVADSRCQGVQVTPPDPGSDCPAMGTVLRQYLADNYPMPDGTLLYKAQVTEFADGNCGSYQIAFPYIPPIVLPPSTFRADNDPGRGH